MRLFNSVWRHGLMMFALVAVVVLCVGSITPTSLSNEALAAYKAAADGQGCNIDCWNNVGPFCWIQHQLCEPVEANNEQIVCSAEGCDQVLYLHTITACISHEYIHHSGLKGPMCAKDFPADDPCLFMSDLSRMCVKRDITPCGGVSHPVPCPACGAITQVTFCDTYGTTSTVDMPGNTKCQY